MMQFSVRTGAYQNNSTLSICDAGLVGTKISEGEMSLDISAKYYGEKLIDEAEARNLLQSSSIINMAGKETISLSIRLGIGSESGIKKVSGVPFLIVFKM